MHGVAPLASRALPLRRDGEKSVDVTAGRVLANNGSAWIDTKCDGHRRARIVEAGDSRLFRELQESMLLAQAVFVGPNELSPRIDVPYLCHGAVGHVVCLQAPRLHHEAVGEVRSHVSEMSYDDLAVGSRTVIHGSGQRQCRVCQLAITCHETAITERRPDRSEHRRHQVKVVKTAVDVTVGRDPLRKGARVSRECDRRVLAMPVKESMDTRR